MIDDVLKKTLTGRYRGYLLQNVYEVTGEPFTWNVSRKLLRIPHKITYFFDRSKIAEVRKSQCHKKQEDESYLIRLVDGTYLKVNY